MTYNQQVGERLRSIRRQRGMSLQDVERVSAREIKASVLGAYERGERALSMGRLRKLAAFFNVPASHLVPMEDNAASAIQVLPSGGITIDLAAIGKLEGQEAELLENFLRAIQMLRQDFNGKVLTLRQNDLRLLSLLLNQPEKDFTEKLVTLGVSTK